MTGKDQAVRSEKQIEHGITTLGRIRDILLQAGIQTTEMDESLARVCQEIDSLYAQLLKTTHGSVRNIEK